MVGGRNAWRMESEPKTGLKAANPGDDEILATHRITWFDEEEGVELRYRTVYTRRIHSIQAGTLDENEWSKVGDAWLPSTHLLRLQALLRRDYLYAELNCCHKTRSRVVDKK
jgi:hypothetical protein